jgi:hypothetical protein
VTEPTHLMKVIGFPALLYKQLRNAADSQAATNRAVLRAAVEEQLAAVEEIGFAPGEGPRKLVRSAIDRDVLDSLKEAAGRSGVDSTALTMLCLRRHLGMRLVDKNRNEALRKLNPPKSPRKKSKPGRATRRK